MAAIFELIETEMFEGPWVAGSDYSIADPYLFTLASWMESDKVDPKRFPALLDHRQRMGSAPGGPESAPLARQIIEISID